MSLLLVRRLRSAVVALCGIGLALAGGCNKSDMPPRGAVHGLVTLDGKPVAGATVIFAPVAGGRRAKGVTSDAGEYTLVYLRDLQGAAVGKNKVQITKQPTHDTRSELIPAKYNQATELVRDVKSGDNKFDFDLTSK